MQFQLAPDAALLTYQLLPCFQAFVTVLRRFARLHVPSQFAPRHLSNPGAILSSLLRHTLVTCMEPWIHQYRVHTEDHFIYLTRLRQRHFRCSERCHGGVTKQTVQIDDRRLDLNCRHRTSSVRYDPPVGQRQH